MLDTKVQEILRTKRHYRIRKRLSGTPERPRLVVFRSLKNIYVQLVDDTAAKTLLAAGTDSKELAGLPKCTKTERAIGQQNG